jgi:glycosyltransferase involved in cell wall biosynthesis
MPAKRNRIAICHQTFMGGDAIGNDIGGMYRVLESMGFEPVVLCEHNPHRLNQYRISHSFSVKDLRSYSLIIYHHSQFWELGKRLLEDTKTPIVLRFHNITPSRFFRNCSAVRADLCERGEEMTRRLARLSKPHQWLADSQFNGEQLTAAGVSQDRVTVVPPFNRIQHYLRQQNKADYSKGTIDILFAGRFAPHKGYLHLLHIVKALQIEFGLQARLLIAGARDQEFKEYHREFVNLAFELQLNGAVFLHQHIPQPQLDQLFRDSHVYLCMSEHEGFCVPIIEAQAMGLPIVGTTAGAKKETAGPQQLLSTIPTGPADYSFYASLVYKVFTERALRSQVVRQGYLNVITRFTDEVVENQFVNSVSPMLIHKQ